MFSRSAFTQMLKTCVIYSRNFHAPSPLCSSDVQLTRLHYDVKRGNFSQISDNDLKVFCKILDESRVITDPDELDAYNTDWMRNCRGESTLLLKPRNTAEISSILAHCNKQRLAVCPQGGNTALVGNSVPVFDEIILSTQLMNNVISFDTLSSVLVCESGCILQQLEEYLSDFDHIPPIDLGAKGSCNIGGNIATNAGGLRLFRYGNFHGNVLGLEVVLSDGKIIDLTSAMMKDNTGYDLKQLFIGSEGTLGIITKVVIKCPPKPKSVNLAFLALDSFQDVLKVVSNAKSHLSEVISSCEFIDIQSIDCLKQNMKLYAPVLPRQCNMLIETSGSRMEHDQEKLSDFLEQMMELGLVKDGTLASSSREVDELWALRESIPEAVMRDGYAWMYDVSLPHERFNECVENTRERVKQYLGDLDVRVCGYGHLGDGNVHVNVSSREFRTDIEEILEPHIFEWTARHGGSISAEHGIGFKKSHLLHLSKQSTAIALMHNIKNLIDPNGILNPYKVLPSNNC